MDILFDPKFINYPRSFDIVVFSCDENYFLKYGIYNILSCNRINQDVHVNVINPSDVFFNILEKLKSKLEITLSISFERVEIENFYAMKSYLFCNRYLISLYLFNNCLIDSIYITDADIVFKERLIFNEDEKLGLNYMPNNETLWKKCSGNFVFIRKNKIDFLSKVVSEFLKRYKETQWADFSSYTKIDRANVVGLDQVCLSYVLENYDKEGFFNTAKFVSKNKNCQTAKIWTLTGGNQKEDSIGSLAKEFDFDIFYS